MLTKSEILVRLGNWLSPGDVAEVVRKLLRVPEAWAQVHDPDFLDQVLDENAEENLVPASLVNQFIHSQEQADGEAPEEPLETQLARLWEESEQLLLGARDLQDVASLSARLSQVAASPIHPEIISHLLENFERWKSPLACAWPNLEHGNNLLKSLLVQNWDIGSFLSLNTLLANYSYPQAIPILFEITSNFPRHNLFLTLSSREPRFLDVIATHTEILDSSYLPEHSPDTQLALSILAHLQGYLEVANESLEQAHELSLDFAARLEDQKAVIAHSSEASEAELEAREQAIAIQSSNERTANLSLLLSQQEKFTEAMEVLPPEPQSLAEMMAAYQALKGMGEGERARKYMQNAIQEALINPMEDPLWINQMMDRLREDGDLSNAIKVALVRVDHSPGDSESLIDLADLLIQGGDPNRATEFASLAYALAPQSTSTRFILATSLQESGKALEALAHWQILAEENSHALYNVAECALQADFADLALDVAERVQHQEPESAVGQVLLGRALAANGDLEEAIQVLETATQDFPDDPNTWITLATCQEQGDDPEAAGRTLATAIQYIPENADLLHTYAQWLENQGRHSEAVEFAERAYQAEPKVYKHLVKYGNLLRKIGQYEEALSILKKATTQKPFQWEGLLALAQTFEGFDDSSAAARSMKNCPPTAPAEAHIYAARISLRAAREHEDQDYVEDGIDHLDQARSKGSTDPLIPFLQGQIDELQGNPLAALESYEKSARNFIQKDPELFLESKLGMARTAVATEQIPLATANLEEARLRYPHSIDVLLTLSRTYLQSGNELDALKTIEHALKIEPANRAALKQIAKISSQLKTWAPAIHALKKSVDLAPEDPEAWIDFAENALIVGNMNEAKEALSEALRLNRKDPQILAQSAKVFYQMGETDSARRLLEQALDLNTDRIEVLKQLASVAEDLADFETAIEAWERVSALEPGDRQALSKTAQAYWALDEHAAAMDLWNRILKFEPGDLSTIKILANAYIAQGKLDTGLSLFHKAISQNPEDVEIALQAAQVAMDIGLIEEAFDILTDMIRRFPKRTDILLTTADCLIQRNQPKSALEVLDTVIVEELFPAKWFALVAIASAMTHDLSRAYATFEQGCKHPDLDGREIALLAKAAFLLNRWADAMEILSTDIPSEDDHERIIMEAQIRLRALETQYIYSESDVVAHAPPASLRGEENLTRVRELLSTASNLPLNKARVDQLLYRSRLLSGPGELDHLLQNRSFAEEDQSGETLEAMSLAKLRSGHPQEALNIIALRDDFDGEGELFDFITGLCQRSLGRLPLAREAFRDAQEKLLLKPMGQYLEAKVLFDEGEDAEAKLLLNTALTSWPDEHMWQFQLGSSYIKEGDLDSALPHLQEAAELAPDNEKYNLSLARALRDTGHLSQAYARFTHAVHNDPEDPLTWYEAGSIALANGDAEAADKFFDRACSLSPSDPHCLVGSARAALALGVPKVAMERVQEALRLTPEDPDTLIAAGEVYAKQGKFDKAISSYEQALSKASDPVPIHLARIRLLVQAGRAAEAMIETSKFIDAYPENEKMWASHAEVCEATNELQQAQAAASKAVKLAPNNPTYRLMLGRLARKAGQLDRALDELSRLEKSDPGNPQLLLEMGQLYEDRRQYRNALDAYQRAITIDDQLAQAYFRSGLVLKQLKSYPEAGMMLSKAVSLEPNNPDAHHQLAAVRALELVHGGIQQAVMST